MLGLGLGAVDLTIKEMVPILKELTMTGITNEEREQYDAMQGRCVFSSTWLEGREEQHETQL